MASKNCGFTFTWTLQNINCLALYDELKSPVFVANCLEKTEWQLGCILKEDQQTKKIETYLRVRKIIYMPYNMSVSYRFLLYDADNNCLINQTEWRVWFHRGRCVGESKISMSKESFSKIKTVRCLMWRSEYSEEGIQFCETEQGFARTRICLERRLFIWTIENVSQLEQKTSFITTDSKKCLLKSINLIRNTSRICENKLQVELRNNLTNDNCKYNPQRYTYCTPYPYIQDCQISIVDSKGNVMVLYNDGKWKTTEENPFEKIPGCQSHDKYCFQFSLNTTNKECAKICLQNDLLRFQCECEICFGVELNQLEDANSKLKENTDDMENRPGCSKIATSSDTPTSKFMEDVQQLWADKQFCDFNLKAHAEIFPVHRDILSVRSPVFKSMFSHDMKENACLSVDINDLNADTVRRMLVYIYTDNVGDITWKDAFDLYIAGDKYQLLDLKERCSAILKSNFFPSNVCEILVLADEHHDENLIKAAQDYIVDHDDEIIHLDSWKNIERTNPNLGFDILKQIVHHKKKGLI